MLEYNNGQENQIFATAVFYSCYVTVSYNNIIYLHRRYIFHYITGTMCRRMEAFILYYNMVRWISAPGTMHFRPRHDTF